MSCDWQEKSYSSNWLINEKFICQVSESVLANVSDYTPH